MPFKPGNTPWNKGKSLSEQTRAKISAAALGRPSAFKGRTHTPEALAQMSAKLKGRVSPFKGHQHTPETLAKMSASKKGRPLTDAQRAGLARTALANTGRKHSPETIAKMSAAQRARDPATFARGPREPRSNGYAAIHRWLRHWHPKTGICERCHVDVGPKGRGGTHYALRNQTEPYTRDRDDYLELCPACHVRFDRDAYRL